jgi:hypothetical protein
MLFRPSPFGTGPPLTEALVRSVDYRTRVSAERFTDPGYVRNAEATEAVVSSACKAVVASAKKSRAGSSSSSN